MTEIVKCEKCGEFHHFDLKCEAQPPIRVQPVVSCRCGCGQPAQYFFTGTDYGGEPITEEPCCYTAMLYLRDSSIEAGLSWKVRPAANVPS